MTKRFLLALATLALAACASDPLPPPPAPLNVGGSGRIVLDVQTLNSFTHARGPAAPSGALSGRLLEPTLTQALTRWGAERFRAQGLAGQAVLTIQEAQVTQKTLPLQKGFESWFTRQQATEYMARVKVSLEARSGDGLRMASASAHAEQTASLPEKPTESERQQAWAMMVQDLMDELNRNMDKAVRDHMGDFVLPGGR